MRDVGLEKQEGYLYVHNCRIERGREKIKDGKQYRKQRVVI